MNVVDSSAWLEYFSGGPHASAFAPAIEDVAALLVPSIVLLEVARRVMQQRGEDAALQIAAAMHQGSVVPLDSAIALLAARLGVQHRLPMADSVIYATAQRHDALLWTMDSDFSALDGVKYYRRLP